MTLMSIMEFRDSYKKPAGKPTNVLNEYIGYYCNSLVERGFLKKPGIPRGYQLTPAGKEALRDFPPDNIPKIEELEQITPLRHFSTS